MSRAGAFPLVTVSGACSRAGKTACAESLLRALPAGQRAAVKFTTTDDVFERCPRGTTCVVCDIDVPFRIIDDPAVLVQAGTDTARLLGAGAQPMLWAIAKRSAAGRAWQAVCQRLEGVAGSVVVEGSTITDVAPPDLGIFVVHPFLAPQRWKDGSAARLQRADFVVLNRPGGDLRPPDPAVLAALRAARVSDDALVADVTRPLADWSPRLAERLAVLAASPEASRTPEPRRAAVA